MHRLKCSYAQGIDESVAADENRVRFAAALIEREKPALTTVYLASVDHQEHAFGPGSPEAKAAIAANDAMIGRLVDAARAAEPDLTVIVVSDHGFAPLATDVNLLAPFIAEGLIRFDPKGKVVSWEAEPWLMGGTAAILLARPGDAALRDRVAALLNRLARDPAMGIDRVLDRAAIGEAGGATGASFLVAFRPGYEAGYDPALPAVTASRYKGMHGYLPSEPAMRSSLFAEGPGLTKHGDLGTIDMRAIAPTIAHILGVTLLPTESPSAF